MSRLTWITEKELEREIKNKGDEFCWKDREGQRENFISVGGEKMRNTSGQQGEAKRREQERKQQNLW